jgi:hypothetical protein
MISVSTLQLLDGSSTSFLHLSFPAYAKWIEQGWLTSIWKITHRVGFEIHLKHQWSPQTPERARYNAHGLLPHPPLQT